MKQVQEARSYLERFTADMLYTDEHRQELLKSYADRWIAVCNGNVVAVEKNLEMLIKKLEQLGLPPGHVYQEYLTEREEQLILVHSAR